MKFSLALSIGVTAHLFDIPTCVSAFLTSPLLPLKPQSLHVARTRIKATLPRRASFVPPWTQWTTGTTAVSEAALELQQKLRQLCSERSAENRGDRIKELAKELNALNPTRSPALSSSLEGKWKLIYSDIPGPSGGRVGPFSADVFQEIRSRDKRIVNTLELGPNRVFRGALEADVEVVDANTWALTFDFVRGRFADVQVQFKKFDASTERRIWSMTYLDEGFRVLYGRQESTSADKAYIFIMEQYDFEREGGRVV